MNDEVVRTEWKLYQILFLKHDIQEELDQNVSFPWMERQLTYFRAQLILNTRHNKTDSNSLVMEDSNSYQHLRIFSQISPNTIARIRDAMTKKKKFIRNLTWFPEIRGWRGPVINLSKSVTQFTWANSSVAQLRASAIRIRFIGHVCKIHTQLYVLMSTGEQIALLVRAHHHSLTDEANLVLDTLLGQEASQSWQLGNPRGAFLGCPTAQRVNLIHQTGGPAGQPHHGAPLTRSPAVPISHPWLAKACRNWSESTISMVG